MKLHWTTATMLGLGLAACDKKSDAPATENATPAAETAKTDEAAKTGEADKTSADMVKAAAATAAAKIEGAEALAGKAADLAAIANNADKPPLDAAAYEKLIVDHASCEVTAGGDIDPKCPAVKALRDATSGGQALKALGGGSAALGRKLLTHEAPAVRIKGAGLLRSITGTASESQDAIVAAAKTEQNTGVIQAFIGAVSNDGAKNPKVAELLLWAADHADANVRTKAVYALGSTWNREMAGGPEKLIALMENDADMGVREAACKYAGKLGDAKFMPSYTKLTGDGVDPKLKTKCVEGLIQMWWSFPFHENANEDAYKLTLAILNKKPRTTEDPYWTIPGTFRSRNEDKFTAWKATAPWYKEEDLKAALIDIVKDTNANWMARTGAVDSLGVNGTKADLEALLAGFPEDVKGNDGHVRRKLTETIAKAK